MELKHNLNNQRAHFERAGVPTLELHLHWLDVVQCLKTLKTVENGEDEDDDEDEDVHDDDEGGVGEGGKV
ncbi:hypothetical protein TRAPUB_2648 [Trametes pubescens]|uniref:Uncharacterized protein n=1 Tax=Trametes pubescens TaxID=154538 RepID=A0A1M2VFV5_TRAPU|nr:hypothetical protein TRAPUB_2648 [Trametes pubescens]